MSTLHRIACSMFVQSAMEGLRIGEPEMVLMAAPQGTNEILQDLQTIPEIRGFRVSYGDAPIVRGRDYVYASVQDILRDLKMLQAPLDRDALVATLVQAFQNDMGTAQGVADLIEANRDSIYKGNHRKLAKLISQLSNNAQECIKNGVTIQVLEDAWDRKLQDMNYSFLNPGQ